MTIRAYVARLRSEQCGANVRPALTLAIPHWLARIGSHVCDLLHVTPFSFGHLQLMQHDNVPRVNYLAAAPAGHGKNARKINAANSTRCTAPWITVARPLPKSAPRRANVSTSNTVSFGAMPSSSGRSDHNRTTRHDGNGQADARDRRSDAEVQAGLQSVAGRGAYCGAQFRAAVPASRSQCRRRPAAPMRRRHRLQSTARAIFARPTTAIRLTASKPKLVSAIFSGGGAAWLGFIANIGRQESSRDAAPSARTRKRRKAPATSHPRTPVAMSKTTDPAS